VGSSWVINGRGRCAATRGTTKGGQVRVVVAPDGFGGTLAADEAARAIATGWARSRPEDELVSVPMSDGGEGLLRAIARAQDTWQHTEVAGPHGHPVAAAWLVRPDGTAVIESAAACGLHLVPVDRRDPMLATTYGVGQLLEAARAEGARRVVVGLGGSATVDGGSGALGGLGFRLRVEHGSGLRIGGAELGQVARVERGWVRDWSGIEVVLLADVSTPLGAAAATFGPQKGATPAQVDELARALMRWADVVARDLTPGDDLRHVPGSGAAGGLGFALAASIGARFEPGSAAVGELVGLPDELDRAELVVTGEGRLDATTRHGKVVAFVQRLASERRLPTLAVVGQVGDDPLELEDVEAASPDGPGDDPAGDVAQAAARLAARLPARPAAER
jgi:glycerate 2-kinase